MAYTWSIALFHTTAFANGAFDQSKAGEAGTG